VPYGAIHAGKEYPDDCPDLAEIDEMGNIKQSPDIWPNKGNIIEHAPPSRFDNPKTVTADDPLLLIGEVLYFKQGGQVYPLNASKRGPHRPSQSVLQEQAMYTNFEHCLDPVQASMDHHNNPRKNAFRLDVLCTTAGVEMDYDDMKERTHLIANIIDRVNPENPPVKVYANEQECEAYGEACDMAASTGWAVHLANDCQKRFYQNMRTCFAERDPDHGMRSLTDPVYWAKHHTNEQECIKLYQLEISILEAIRAQVIRFLDGVIRIGAARRQFFTMSQRPQPPKRTLSELTAYRYDQTGIPDENSDVHRVLPSGESHKFLAKVNGYRYVKIPNFPTILMPTPGVDNTEVPSLLGGPPDWAVVPEGTTSIPTIGQLLPQDNVEEIRTSLAIPEGCFTACPYGLRNGKPDTLARTDEASGGPTPGIDCPGEGDSGATPSTPTSEEPPPAEC
jgi:hypothetical protein